MSRSGGKISVGVMFTVSMVIFWSLCGSAATAQDTPFATSNPFETSGERPIRLFGDGNSPAPFPPATAGDTVLWSAVAKKKDGGHVDGLNRDAFTVELDGGKQELAFFARRPDASDEKIHAASGWYVALFDLTIADPAKMKEACLTLLEEAENRLEADEQVAVIFFDGRLEVVVPFTRDPAMIRRALARIPDRSIYSTHDFFGRRVRVSARGETRITSTLDQSDDTAQHNFAAYRFFTEMRRLAIELGKVPGRKQVMLYSGGFNRRWLAKEDVAYLRMVDAMCRATAVIYSYNAVDEDYLERILEYDGISRKRMEKAGVTELKYAARFLRELSESTGGLAWTAEDGKQELIQTMFSEGRHHYLLGFHRSAGTRTGNFLACEVKSDGVSDIRAPLGFYDN